jgi:hypothetical protein
MILKRFLLGVAMTGALTGLLAGCSEPKPDVTVDAGDPLAAASDGGATDSGASEPAPAPGAS